MDNKKLPLSIAKDEKQIGFAKVSSRASQERSYAKRQDKRRDP